jgi:hypothetical protein
MTPLTAEKIAELERLLGEFNVVIDGDYLARLANGARINFEIIDWMRENGASILSLAKRVAGAPVGEVTHMHTGGPDVVVMPGAEEFRHLVGTHVALVEIVGGEEGNGS